VSRTGIEPEIETPQQSAASQGLLPSSCLAFADSGRTAIADQCGVDRDLTVELGLREAEPSGQLERLVIRQ
jgi:hypothetical protein